MRVLLLLLPVNCMLKLPRVSFSFARVSDCKFKTGKSDSG